MPSKIRKKALITNQIVQNVRVHRLDCDFLHMQQSQVFLRQGPYFIGFLIIIFFIGRGFTPSNYISAKPAGRHCVTLCYCQKSAMAFF